MGLTFRYSHPTTPAGTGFQIDYTEAVPWGSLNGLVTMAAAGEVGVSTVYLDDPDGILDIKGLQRATFIESEASTDPIWNGYIGDQRIGRIGSVERFTSGAARSWEISLSDDNAILSFRVIYDTDGNRPAETGSARLAWLLASDYSGEVVDAGYVTYPGTTYTMDACDYRGQFAKDVLADIALQCGGVNFFCQYDLSTSGTTQYIGLWFGDSNASTAFTSTSSIDNRPGSADGTAIFYPSDDTVLIRDPSRIAAGVYLPYNGGSIYAKDLNTSYEFWMRDQVAPTATISSQAQATALTDHFLATFDEQDEKVTTRIWMPPANLYDIRAGHRILATFQHLPGYETGRYCRVTQKSTGNFNTSTGLYEVGLELSPQGPPCVEINLSSGTAMYYSDAESTHPFLYPERACEGQANYAYIDTGVAWVPAEQKVYSYINIDLGEPALVYRTYRVLYYSNWETEALQCSDNGSAWTDVAVAGDFVDGNYDEHTNGIGDLGYWYLDDPTTARYWRIKHSLVVGPGFYFAEAFGYTDWWLLGCEI